MTSQNHMHIFTSYPWSLALFVRSRNKFQLWMDLLRATLPHTQTDVFEICHSSHLCFWFFWVSWHPCVDACHVLPLRVFLQVHSPSVISICLSPYSFLLCVRGKFHLLSLHPNCLLQSFYCPFPFQVFIHLSQENTSFHKGICSFI